MLGSALAFANDPFGFLTASYRSYGPVFPLKILGQRMVMMVGREANLFLKQHERSHFLIGPAYERLGTALGTKRFLLGMDGDAHRQLRGAYGPAMDRASIESYVPELSALTSRAAADTAARTTDATAFFKRLAFTQLGATLANVNADADYHHVVRVFDTAVKIGVARMWPRFMAHNPLNRISMARLRRLGERMFATNAPSGRGPNFVDRVRQAVERGLLERDDLTASLMSPFFAGIDTVASSMAFALYALLEHPEALERVRGEVCRECRGGIDMDTLRRLPLLKAAIAEALRRYPIAVLTVRQVSQAFDFGGYRFEAGTMVGFSSPLPHFLEEYFPDPLRFDIDRFAKTMKPSPSGTYQPYGVGAHLCLGAGLANVQMAVTLAVCVRDFEVEREPGYRLSQVLDPLPVPRGFRVRFRPGVPAELTARS